MGSYSSKQRTTRGLNFKEPYSTATTDPADAAGGGAANSVDKEAGFTGSYQAQSTSREKLSSNESFEKKEKYIAEFDNMIFLEDQFKNMLVRSNDTHEVLNKTRFFKRNTDFTSDATQNDDNSTSNLAKSVRVVCKANGNTSHFHQEFVKKPKAASSKQSTPAVKTPAPQNAKVSLAITFS